jgi:hypothetical protein
MRPRSFRIRPTDDNELLAVQPFGFAPEARVSWRVRRADCLRNYALKAELAGVPQNEFAVAGLMAVEPKARLVRDQWLKKRLALDERQTRDVAAVEMQEIEGVINEARPALAVGHGLGIGEAR